MELTSQKFLLGDFKGDTGPKELPGNLLSPRVWGREITCLLEGDPPLPAPEMRQPRLSSLCFLGFLQEGEGRFMGFKLPKDMEWSCLTH